MICARRFHVLFLTIMSLCAAIVLAFPLSAQAATVTAQIDLSANPASFANADDHYAWDQATKTLTLDEGFKMAIASSTATGKAIGIILPDGARLVVEGNANVAVSVDIATTAEVCGVQGAGDLTIDGGGNLICTAKNAANESLSSAFECGSIGVVGDGKTLTIAPTFTGFLDITGDHYGLASNGFIEFNGGGAKIQTGDGEIIAALYASIGSIAISNSNIETVSATTDALADSIIYSGKNGDVGISIDNSQVSCTYTGPTGVSSVPPTCIYAYSSDISITNGSIVNTSGGQPCIWGTHVEIADSSVTAHGQLYGIRTMARGIHIVNSTVDASESRGYITAHAISCAGLLSIENSTVSALASGEQSSGIFITDNNPLAPAQFSVTGSRIVAEGTLAGIRLSTDSSDNPITLASPLVVLEGGKIASVLNPNAAGNTTWAFSPTGSISYEGSKLVGASTRVVIDKMVDPEIDPEVDPEVVPEAFPATGDRPWSLNAASIAIVAATALIATSLFWRKRAK